MTEERKRLAQVQRWLTLYFPPSVPVTVRIEALGDDSTLADVGEGYGGIYIRIEKNTTQNERIDCLMHEWAHIDVDEGDKTDSEDHRRDHGPKWGSKYQKIVELWQDEGGEDDSYDL
jgi:hypothetical protein